MNKRRGGAFRPCGVIALLIGSAAGLAAADSAPPSHETTAGESPASIENVMMDNVPGGGHASVKGAATSGRQPIEHGGAWLGHATRLGPGKVQVRYPDSYRERGVTPLRYGEDKLIYSNTRSYPADEVLVYRPGRGVRIADDLITEAIGTCDLTMLRFMVNGGGDPDDPGAFMVQAKLWDGCPNAEGTLIDGTTFTYTLDDDSEDLFYALEMPFGDRGICDDAGQANCQVSLGNCGIGVQCVPNPQPVPPTVWLQVVFTTDTAGVVVGTLATRGFSADAYDHPFGHCTAWQNGDPYMAFWVEMYATDACPVQFLAYLAADGNMPAFIPPGGAATRVADDITLVADPNGPISCELTAYELGMRGTAGPFTMDIDLRWAIPPMENVVIQGTHFVFQGRGEGTLEIAHVEVPPGVVISREDQPIYMTWQPSRGNTGAIVEGRTEVGSSSSEFFTSDCWWCPWGCQWGCPPDLPDDLPGIFHAAIYCRGEPPLGSCCPDQPDELGAEMLCYSNVPVVGCLGPRNGGGPWVPNVPPHEPLTCAADLFDPPCGVHACCKPDWSGEDLTRDECLSICETDGEIIECTTDDDCPGPRTCGAYQCHGCAGFTGIECNPAAGDAGCDTGETCERFDPTICTAKCARWSPGQFTGDSDYFCPIFTCLEAEGYCFAGEPEIACDDDCDCPDGENCITDEGICTRRVGCAALGCCDIVCSARPSCCLTGWDDTCADYAWALCDIPPCPGGQMRWSDPDGDPLDPDGIVDARQPHGLTDTTPQGWRIFDVEAPAGAGTDLADGCWSVCETGEGAAPGISGVLGNADGTYTITLDREITPGALTTLTYTSFVLTDYVGKYALLPGDVDGDRTVTTGDIDALINCINYAACSEWQSDADRSGTTNARDIIREIDLLNGAGAYDYWLGKTVPTACQ